MMCLLNVYLVCNHATECKKDGCKKRLAYTLSVHQWVCMNMSHETGHMMPTAHLRIIVLRIKCSYEKCMPSGNPIGKYSKCLYDQRDIKYSYYGCGSPYFS